MKIFFYALREYDEQKYVEEFAKKYPFEYGYFRLSINGKCWTC